ncbi:Uncharacterised protein [Vibrio cholerae]|nr:Uncharacterised protein [Vibrio cholerae]
MGLNTKLMIHNAARFIAQWAKLVCAKFPVRMRHH